MKVAVVPQPNWKDDLRDFKKLGRPKYFFGVTAGNMDSMVNHYTAAKRIRSNDAYTAGGKAGFRPDYPTITYTSILKSLFPDVPVIIGGIEASMRRLTHYDYWQDRLKPSVLAESNADMLIYGMGEGPVREVVRLLKKGVPFSSLKTVPQTAFMQESSVPAPARKAWNTVVLNSYEECISDKSAFAANFVRFETESNKIEASRLVEAYKEFTVIVNPPFPPAETGETDEIYDLPFTYLPHPKYRKKGTIPAYEMIKFSVNIHRGCFGGCSFCAIAAHQGKHIVSRSEESVIREISKIMTLPGFSGYLSDLGGPSANMYGMKGINMDLCRKCSRPSCIWPKVCRNLDVNHRRLTLLYKKVNSIDGIRKAFIGSGIRYDLLFPEGNPRAGKDEMDYLEELIRNHVSGRLKVAPEHTAGHVLSLMRKASFSVFRIFRKHFLDITKRFSLNYELIPYFISSMPGCTEKDMRDLAREVKGMGVRMEQVQDFTPTPMTLSTVIFYLGFDPYSGRKIFVEKRPAGKKRQKGFFFSNPSGR